MALLGVWRVQVWGGTGLGWHQGGHVAADWSEGAAPPLLPGSLCASVSLPVQQGSGHRLLPEARRQVSRGPGSPRSPCATCSAVLGPLLYDDTDEAVPWAGLAPPPAGHTLSRPTALVRGLAPGIP